MLELIIKPDSVLCNAQATSKKHCLEILSELLVRHAPQISTEDIVSRLIERERLGCTGLGQGVAFPHCRIPALHTSVAALIKLSEPVDFDCYDGNPVDIVFGLIVPQDIDATHQASIVSIAELLGDRVLRQNIRAAETSKQLYDSLMESEGSPVVFERITAASPG
ncbi:MAG: PTS sugar transporter subunit IIA [Gammaproteobacteria bacterium]|nr:PTS sugar transporter subunit IIA [Gammaproteobacteria bacterium]